MAAVHVAALLSHPAVRSAIERALAARGVHGDTMLIHANPREAAMLRFMGGVGTVNPRTGLRQFYEIGGDGSGGYSRGDVGSGNLGQGAGGGSADALGGGVGSSYGGGPGNQGGSGLGAGGGHSGQNYYSQTMYGGGVNQTPARASYAPAASISNMPAPVAPSLTPMMSSTATTDLASSRFGALPSWATTPYQIGMAPSSYPTPGVNAALGAPGAGGAALPGGGGAGLPGGGAALPGAVGGGVTPIGTPISLPGGGTQQPVVRTPAGLGVQLPGGAVALLNLNGPPAIGGGSINTPTLPNGQTLSQYLTSLKLGLMPNMPGAPTAMAQTAPSVQAAAQPVASRLATAFQAAPGAFQQLHPAVANALAQGILGGTIPNYAQQIVRGKVTSGSR